jgi:hypothetical protein
VAETRVAGKALGTMFTDVRRRAEVMTSDEMDTVEMRLVSLLAVYAGGRRSAEQPQRGETEAVAEAKVRLKKATTKVRDVSCLVSRVFHRPSSGARATSFVSAVTPAVPSCPLPSFRHFHVRSIAFLARLLTSILVAQIKDTALVGAARGDAHGRRAERGSETGEKESLHGPEEGDICKREVGKLRCVGLEIVETRN